MKPHRINILTIILSGGILAAGGCQMNPGASFNPNNQAEIRAAAQQFATAMREADPDRVRDATDASQNAQNNLSREVVRDTVSSRKVIAELDRQFNYTEQKPTVIGSDPWITRFEAAAVAAPIQRVSVDRARLTVNGGSDIYLRQIDGQWKVELIPTLVDESNGKPTVADPVVEYRFGVTRAMKEWMLVRLERNDFDTKQQFDDARNRLWMDYLTFAANGKDPKDMLLPSLPAMPVEDGATADER